MAQLGLPEALVYFTAKDPQSSGRYYFSALATVAIIAFPVFVLGYIALPHILAKQSMAVITAARGYLLMLIPFWTLIGLSQNLMRGRNELNLWNVMRVLPLVNWFIVLLIAWVLGIHKLTSVATGFLVQMQASALILTFIVIKKISDPIEINFSTARQMLGFGLPAVASTAPQLLNLRLDQMLMASVLSAKALGLYIVAVAWSSIANPILQGLGRVLFPRVASLSTQEQKTLAFTQGCRVSILGATVTSVALVAVTPFFLLKRIDTLVYIPPFRTPAQLNRDEKFSHLAGIKRIIGMNGYRKTECRPAGIPLPHVPHEADILLSHLALDGVKGDDDPYSLMSLGLSDDERAFADDWLKQNAVSGSLLIGIGPGSKMPSKLWPIERFIEVVKALDERYHPTFLVFGSQAKRETCQQVCDAVERGFNTAGELTIRQSAALFEHCPLYVGNDTGTMHIAASSGTPCVALFSARDWPGRWYPYGPKHKVHRFFVPCEGCMLEFCDKDNLCLKSVGTEEVLRSAIEIIESFNPPSQHQIPIPQNEREGVSSAMHSIFLYLERN